MTGLIDNLRTLGRTRLLVLAGTGVGIVLAVATMAVLLSRPHMTPLYTGLEPAEAGRIVKAVEAMGVPVSAAFDGTAVQVPEAEVPRLRMLLAEKGLPSRGGIGYELFDTDKPLGITSFMQRMNRLRAMEGELARTIETLSGIEAARENSSRSGSTMWTRAASMPDSVSMVRVPIVLPD
ncbi:flagellar M-ring protein FliF, partial [Azospirillum brasilense]|nr:flagellar M-ring protein FliF [Azospirillum argentinense]